MHSRRATSETLPYGHSNDSPNRNEHILDSLVINDIEEVNESPQPYQLLRVEQDILCNPEGLHTRTNTKQYPICKPRSFNESRCSAVVVQLVCADSPIPNIIEKVA